MSRPYHATWIFPIILAWTNYCQANLVVEYEWKYIDYVWESNAQKTALVDAGAYDYTKIITNDIQPLPDGRVLVTTPRYYNNPASLSSISNQTGDGGPLLAPYPSWSWYQSDNCSGITSVNRVFLDDCERLWLVDSGKIGNQQLCPAKILAFDPNTDELLEEFVIPSELSHSPYNESKGLLEMQVVETTKDSCDNIWVYLYDLDGYGILIWNRTDIWRLDDEIFVPTTEGETFSIDGESFTLRKGPEGLLITPPGFLEQPYLLMKPLSSVKTFAATLEDLHNSKSGHGVNYYITNWTAPCQEPGKVFAKTGGTVFAAFVFETALGCWNIQSPLEDTYVGILETNSTTLQFVSSAKISTEQDKDTLWVTSNRFQKFMLNTTDFSEVNFRIMTSDVATLVEGTVCESQEHTIENSIEDKNFLYLKTS